MSARRMAEEAAADAVEREMRMVVCEPPSRPYGNAQIFQKVRYSHPEHPLLAHQGGEWYRWDGTCWPTFDQGKLRAELYDFFEHGLYQDTDGKQKPFDPSRRKVDDLLDALRAVAYVPVETEAPSWLTGVPSAPAGELVACQNGLVHVPTRRLYPHSPRYYVHHAVPFDFDPNAPPPERWHGFLNDLWNDDAESIGTLQEMFGYAVSGDTRMQKMFLLIGPKRGGKGTIARVLTALLGRHHVAGPTLAGMGTNFGLSPLIGKPVAIVSDARLGQDSSSIVTERLLSISGEDTLTIDRKYREPWTGQLPTRIVILSNELPRLTDSSGALASRFIVFMLTQSFYGRENPALTDELIAELPGIFNWALDGLERLKARGRFQQPSASQDAIRDLEDLGSPIGAFVRDRCQIGPGFDVPVDSLYQAWRSWCDEGGRRPTSIQVFGRDLRAAYPGIGRTRPRDGEDRARRYRGIRLTEGWQTMAGSADHCGPSYQDAADEPVVRDGPRTEPLLTTRHDGPAEPPSTADNNALVRGPSRTGNGVDAPACSICGVADDKVRTFGGISGPVEHMHTACRAAAARAGQ